MPRSLIAFFAATLIGVGGIVVLATVDDTWGLIFAVVVIFVVIALLMGELEIELTDFGRPVIALEPRGS